MDKPKITKHCTLAAIGAASLLAGCASSSGVFSVGPDAYKISSSAITSFGGSATAKGSAYKQATEVCAKQGKQMLLVSGPAQIHKMVDPGIRALLACYRRCPGKCP